MEAAIGTPAFLPAFQEHIQSTLPSLPIDQVVLQSVLLCLIARDKHLILRTPDEDVGLVVRLVASTLSSVFGMSTHKLKLKDRNVRMKGTTLPATNLEPAAFLRSLFMPPQGHHHHHRRYSHSNQASQDEGSGPGEPTPRKHVHKRTPHPPAGRTERSRSIPNNLAAISQEAFDDNFSLPAASGTSDGPMSLSQSIVSTTTGFVSSASSSPILGPSHGIFKPKAVYPPQIQPSVSAGSNRTTGTPPLPHAHTDPLPLPMRRRGKQAERDRSLKRPSSARPEAIEQSLSQHNLPQALVVSGLEFAPEATHQALARALVDKKFTLSSTPHHQETNYDLPDGFFVVYVCPWDPADRPAVHKILLDKFAMSNNVALSQTTRNEMRAYSLASHSTTFLPGGFGSHSNPGTPTAFNSISLPTTYTPPIHTKPLPGHQHHSRDRSGSYVLSESSASPSGHYSHAYNHHHHHHHQPHHQHTHSHPPPTHKSPIPPHLQTSFTAGPSTPTAAGTPTISSPAFVYPPPRPVLPPHLLPLLHKTMETQTFLSYPLQTYLADLLSAVRMNCRIDAVLVGLRARKDVEALVRAARVVGADLGGGELVRDVWTGAITAPEDDADKEDLKTGTNSISTRTSLEDKSTMGDLGSLREPTTPPRAHHYGRDRDRDRPLRHQASQNSSDDEDRRHLLSPSLASAPSSPHRPRHHQRIRSSKSNSSVQRQRLADAHPTAASPLALIVDDVDMDPLSSAFDRPGESMEKEVDHPGQVGLGMGPMLDISEVDVARIIPRVLSHRVRMRDGYDDEIFSSLLVGASAVVDEPKMEVGEDGEGDESPQGIKDIFVHILAEV